MRNRDREELTPEEYPDVLETTKTVRALQRKHVRTFDDFLNMCSNDAGAERACGLLFDAFTKSMVKQVWEALQKSEKNRDKSREFFTRKWDEKTAQHGVKTAAMWTVDKFWRLASAGKQKC